MSGSEHRLGPKRLVEVDFPLRDVSANCSEEKDSRKGHVPRLHIYPAARPTGSCRAVICAALWPDPEDPLTPGSFIEAATEVLLEFADAALTDQRTALECQNSQGHWRAYSREYMEGSEAERRVRLRAALLHFVADFSAWDSATSPAFLKASRRLTSIAQEARSGGPEHAPLIADPFAGGGSGPLEAARVGASAVASDLNPVAALINKVLLRYVPRYGDELRDRLAKWPEFVQERAITSLQRYFPAASDGAVPVAYIWARTVLSEAPSGEAAPVEIPLLRSMWLARTKKRRLALRWVRGRDGAVQTEMVDVRYADGRTLTVRRPRLEIFTPKSSGEVERGTARRMSATCPCTDHTTKANRVEAQLKERNGGAADARLVCVVLDLPGRRGRVFRLPTEEDVAAAFAAKDTWEALLSERRDGMSVVPEEPLPVMSGVFNAPIYGHSTWGSLFSPRQILCLNEYIRATQDFVEKHSNGDPQFAEALSACAGLLIDRLADLNAALCMWQLNTPNNTHLYSRWALPMVTDFAEVNPLAGAGGSPESSMRRFQFALTNLVDGDYSEGSVLSASATNLPLPDGSVDMIFTDPPYYNAVPYADILDFFHVWLRRSIGRWHPELFAQELTPKDDEICELSGWDPNRYAHKDKSFFETGMERALSEARRVAKPSGLAVVVFAHKSTSGWEAVLNAVVQAGWVVTASWPIDTEMKSRMRAKNSAVLGSSIHLVCRPRGSGPGGEGRRSVGDWRTVLHELPQRMHEWMPRLAAEGVVGADAIFACIGPALEIYSRYDVVEKVSGEPVPLSEYLEHVWAAVSNEALSMVLNGGASSSLEEDARLTAMWLWTAKAAASEGAVSKSSSVPARADSGPGTGYSLEYDAARKIAQGVGAHLENLSHLVHVKGDRATLLSVANRASDLFGGDAAGTRRRASRGRKGQMQMFDDLDVTEHDAEWGAVGAPPPAQGVLDRLHQAMLLFAAGRADALRRFLVDEGVGRDARLWSLAQSLSALYPSGSSDKRWVDGVLARRKSLAIG